jgi:NADH-quinone oxidoreductase subunit M
LNFVLAALVALATLLWPLAAGAQAIKSPVAKGSISVTIPGKDEGPVELVHRESGYVGEFSITNKGAEPLAVSRIALRGDDDDVRAPAKLAARFVEGGGTAITVPPGGVRKVQITWLPDREPRVYQAFAHVMITSSDEAAGEIAVGVRAQIPRGFVFITDRPISWLVFLPLVAVALAIAMQVTGQRDDKLLRQVAALVCAAQCLIALWMWSAFNPDVTRIDGNDGYQFIEHAPWIRSLGVEYFVGVDGASMPMVLLTCLLGLVGVLAAQGIERQPKGFFAFYMLLLSGVLGVFVSLDLVLLFSFWQLVLLPLYFLVGVWGGEHREAAAAKLFVVTLAASGVLLLGILALWANADRTFLVDGTPVSRTSSIPELMRVAFHAKKLVLFGAPLVKVAWICLFIGFTAVLPIFPLHRWLPDALVASPTPVAVIVSGLVVKVGAYGVIRVCYGVLPEASRWAAGTTLALGIVGVLYGALCAMAQTDLKRMVAYATMSQMGFCLIGLGSLTPQGIAACLMQMVSHGLIAAMLLLCIGALEDRVKTRDLGRLGGLAAEAPLYATLFAFALFASAGLPGLIGFWGEALALFGAFPTHRVLSVVGALGIGLGAAYHLSAMHKLLFGKLAEAWRKDPILEPFGGKIPELNARELALVAPIAVVAIILGVWPVPVLSTIAGGVRDITSLVNPPGPDQIALLLRR